MSRRLGISTVVVLAIAVCGGCFFGRFGSVPPQYEYRAQGKLWDVATLKARPLFDIGPVDHNPGHFGMLPDIAFSPDGKLVATSGGPLTACVWDVSTGKAVYEFVKSTKLGTVQAAEFRSESELLVADGRGVWLVNVADQKTTALFDHKCRKVSFSSGGLLFVGDEFDRSSSTSAVDAVEGGRKSLRLQTPLNRYLSFAPKGAKLVSVSYSHDGPYTIRVWNTESGQELTTRHSRDPIAWFPDGECLAVLGEKLDVIELWDLATGKVTSIRHGHETLTALAISPDGKRLASAGRTVTRESEQLSHLKLWDLATLWEIASAKAGQVRIDALVFSPDGQTVATTGVAAVVKSAE